MSESTKVLIALLNDPDHFCLLPPHWKQAITKAVKNDTTAPAPPDEGIREAHKKGANLAPVDFERLALGEILTPEQIKAVEKERWKHFPMHHNTTLLQELMKAQASLTVSHYTEKIKELEEKLKSSAPLSPISDTKHRHHIICLSGSTRFTNEMMMATWEFAKQGIIALGWCVLPTNHESDGKEIDHHLAEKEGIADLLDDEHLDKIDLADEVFVINVGGYIGDGTKREIAYAVKTGKPVKYLEPLAADRKSSGQG